MNQVEVDRRTFIGSLFTLPAIGSAAAFDVEQKKDWYWRIFNSIEYWWKTKITGEWSECPTAGPPADAIIKGSDMARNDVFSRDPIKGLFGGDGWETPGWCLKPGDVLTLPGKPGKFEAGEPVTADSMTEEKFLTEVRGWSDEFRSDIPG